MKLTEEQTRELLGAAICWQEQGSRSRWSTSESWRLWDAVERIKKGLPQPPSEEDFLRQRIIDLRKGLEEIELMLSPTLTRAALSKDAVAEHVLAILAADDAAGGIVRGTRGPVNEPVVVDTPERFAELFGEKVIDEGTLKLAAEESYKAEGEPVGIVRIEEETYECEFCRFENRFPNSMDWFVCANCERRNEV